MKAIHPTTQTWRRFSGITLALAAGWILLSVLFFPVQQDAKRAPREGFLAPTFNLPAIEGGSITLESGASMTIVNFWASWCPPCRVEMPLFEAIHREYSANSVRVIGVNATHQDDLSNVQEFIASEGLTFPIALDRYGDVTRAYQIQAFPTTFIIDARGIIQHVAIGGPISEAWLRSVIQEMLQKAE